jgi:hypothetical protein
MGVRDEIKREIETKILRERENREDEIEKESGRALTAEERDDFSNNKWLSFKSLFDFDS